MRALEVVEIGLSSLSSSFLLFIWVLHFEIFIDVVQGHAEGHRL